MYNYIAIDQYGNHVLIHKHPRKELLEHTGRKFARKMYIDTKTGKTLHVGYVIGGRWFDVFGLEGNKFVREVCHG